MNVMGERPGVYATYEVRGVSYSGIASGVAGAAASAEKGNAGEIYEINSYAEAVGTFGETSALTKIIGVLIKNGVMTVKAIPVENADGDGYRAAFAALAAVEDVKAIVCDKKDAQTAAALADAIKNADERNIHKIGIIDGNGNVDEDTALAKALDSERMVIVSAPMAEGTSEYISAAVAGAVLNGKDPAIPLNGAELYGLGAVEGTFTDGEIVSLVRGGVTPVESIGGKVTVVRGITTRTTTNGISDATYRELTTTLIIDSVIPAVRNALALSFARSKNNAQTRGAIRTRVILELEKKLAAEIIDGYDNVTVSVNADDPTVCDVGFEFTVAHGLNQIRLTAYITV